MDTEFMNKRDNKKFTDESSIITSIQIDESLPKTPTLPSSYSKTDPLNLLAATDSNSRGLGYQHKNRTYQQKTIPIGNENNENDENFSISSDESDELPVWVHGEPRWISGVTDDTTCVQLIEVLLLDEGLDNIIGSGLINDYVITERWRKVERVLSTNTKVLRIWKEWGEVQSEVRLSLRKLQVQDDGVENKGNDSGRESPTLMDTPKNSGILRRRRHRNSKSSPIWITHGQTVHPKSSKATIEKLMRLILEQGVTIQQQLTKLKDREIQINKIEEARHKKREKEHGKNYLLETYLNDLHDSTVADDTITARMNQNDNLSNIVVVNGLDDDKDINTGNSDSGVNTEDTTPSPDMDSSSVKNKQQEKLKASKILYTIKDYFMRNVYDDEENNDFDVDTNRKLNSIKRKSEYSQREVKLLKEHEFHLEQIGSKLQKQIGNFSMSQTTFTNDNNIYDTDDTINNENSNDDNNYTSTDSVIAQINLLEKLITLNKHLQREEELLVRLSAKIRRHESFNPDLNESQIKEAIGRVNTNIEQSQNEIKSIENELEISNEMLLVKSDVINLLNKELEQLDPENGNLSNVSSTDSQQCNGKHQSNYKYFNSDVINILNTSNVCQFFSDQEWFPENSNHSTPITTITSVLPKTITSVTENQQLFADQMGLYQKQLLKLPQTSFEVHNKLSEAVTHSPNSFVIPKHLLLNQVPSYFHKDDSGLTEFNLLTTQTNSYDQRDINQRSNIDNIAKIGPKKLMSNNRFIKCHDSDTEISSLSEDGSHIGTLV